MRRAVKYCGGCNPRFDRVGLVRRLESELGQPFPAAQPGTAYDELYVINGCPARCADISQLTAKKLIQIDSINLPDGL